MPLDDDPQQPAPGVAALAPRDALLTIGDLAERTGVSTATLRMWEERHGFPVAHRLESGHRRYPVAVVAQVQQVVRDRESGVRLATAITRAARDRDLARPGAASSAPRQPSIHARLRRLDTRLPVHKMRKTTLWALSHAIEDEFLAHAYDGYLYGLFQRQEYLAPARERWAEMARTAPCVTVYADFERSDLSRRPREVALAEDSPLRREWAIVCHSEDYPVVLTAWEVPAADQPEGRSTPERDRMFECIWSVDADAVTAAAQVCESVALRSDPRRARTLSSVARPDLDDALDLDGSRALGLPVLHRSGDLRATTDLFMRAVTYTERFRR